MQVETTAITYVQTVERRARGDAHRRRRADPPPGQGHRSFAWWARAGVIEFWAWESAYRLTNAGTPAGAAVRGAALRGERPTSATWSRWPSRSTRAQPDYAIPESSLVALELCEGAYLSSAHRCKVTLPLAEFVRPPEPDWRPGKPYRGQGGRDGRKL